MSDLNLAWRSRMEADLQPYGFVNGRYGDVPYTAVAWVGHVDSVEFGFNIFADNRLIAVVEAHKDGTVAVDMRLAQWLKEK